MLQALSPLTRLAETARDARQTAIQRAADALSDGALRVVSMQARFGAASLAVARHLWFGDAPAAAPVVEAPRPVAKAAAAPLPAPAPEPIPVAAASAPAAPEAPVPAPSPAPSAGPKLFSEAPADADELTVLKGVGPKLSAVLNALGVYTFAQIAAWTPDDIVWIEDKLDFRGRVTREKWVEQAAAKL
jgi:predicted flap endonuclease-1-like 5' DNA nuclease